MNLEKTAGIILRSMIPNRPYHVQWMITRKCNYRCKGCNVWREQDAKELSTEEIKKGLDILKELDVIEIVISGGNPLLREDIKEIIDYASRYFITTVYDNGSMAAEKIDALRNADFVAISIDSLDPAKNDHIKGVKGSWKKAMQSVDRLHEEGINVSVTPTISQFNLYEIIDLTKHFLKKRIPLWYCLYSYDALGESNQLFKIGKKNDMFSISDEKGMVTLCDSLINMQRKNSNILMTTKILEAVKNLYLEDRRTWKCQALQSFFVVDHLGRVAGCHLHKPAASIFDLPRVWNSDEFNILRKMYSECTKCTYLCYIFYSLHGSIIGNLQLAQERWKNAGMFLKRNSSKPLGLAKH
ncbi:MAG TPA: radical SAM protein [Acidobacteriota bacterium]|jgi:MoaA/NifB/PqqE/SkfB family radical SAM enzyme|nr:radical SAM protein [Acidobacteriota bacterium]